MYEYAIAWDWLTFAVRWLHVITAIAWIGSSFYFVALDLGLRKRPDLPAGAYGEATLFNIARFDEVDFCNQSLGAVLAGAALLAGARHEKPSPAFFRGELIAGLILLHVGFYFAMF